uniref:maleylacetoacetate isomerase-like n=1 Tax=Ciona intestinalis TaxID=7719 RepID=UPI00006A4588|nr:maleylacetoacetate isomerase-like [Ciona intestinalis]|eukprot:XP_026696383.1 maleylacetoacetate isomerase-like [Ciona intestinalis]
MSLKLYSYFRSSCSWRVRICLALKSIDYETIPIHLVKDGGQQHQESYKKLNPMAQVPALVVDDKVVITQSAAIIEFLEEKYKSKDAPLLPDDIYKKAKVKEICEMIGSGIQPIQNLAVLNKVGETRMDWGKYWIDVGFQALEKMLQNCAGKYCVGDDITMADAFLVPQVGNAIRFKVDMSQFPIISRINATLEEHPAFKAAHPNNQVDSPDKN